MSAPGWGASIRGEVWTDLPAAGGTRIDFVPDDCVLACAIPDAVDRAGALTARLRPTPRVLALVRAVRVLRLVWFTPGTTTAERAASWRIRTVRTETAAGRLSLDVTAVHPIEDWAAAGWLRTQPAGQRPVFDRTGLYTPAQALGLCVARLADRGATYWSVGATDRTDVRQLDIVQQTPAALRDAIERTWAGETEITSPSGALTDETGYVVRLRNRRGVDADVVRLATDGALARLAVTEDAATLATEVLPTGGDGRTIEHAAWRLALGDPVTGWLSLVDPLGGFGLVQFAHQWEGAYLQRADGVLVHILETARNDLVTSLVRVAPAAVTDMTAGGPGVGEEMELRADSAGARLAVLVRPRRGRVARGRRARARGGAARAPGPLGRAEPRAEPGPRGLHVADGAAHELRRGRAVRPAADGAARDQRGPGRQPARLPDVPVESPLHLGGHAATVPDRAPAGDRPPA
jgi:hypothetical protein